jgi:hypothetical protein
MDSDASGREEARWLWGLWHEAREARDVEIARLDAKADEALVGSATAGQRARARDDAEGKREAVRLRAEALLRAISQELETVAAWTAPRPGGETGAWFPVRTYLTRTYRGEASDPEAAAYAGAVLVAEAARELAGIEADVVRTDEGSTARAFVAEPLDVELLRADRYALPDAERVRRLRGRGIDPALFHPLHVAFEARKGWV